MGEVVMSNENGVSASASGATSSSVVKWERFLPKMVVRVLLVESDDSTRQIITALLRKCSYKVAAVSDGLKAWELLKGRPHNIDLILTEVDLPSISGFSLLTLIMDHKICKNIPIIMMSSQDSVNTVYKCMMRGAADFLVKPIRKNEMKNLWQHVWRRQSSGGLKSPKQKFEATAENNAISVQSSIEKIQECIEKGSDAQSSCTKPEMDTEEEDIVYVEDLSPLKEVDDDLQMLDATDDKAMTQSEDMNGEFNFQTLDNNHMQVDSSREAIDLMGACDNYLKCNYTNSSSNINANNVDSSTKLDLSLRRSHPCGESVNDESLPLNRSDASAFSRYVNKAIQAQPSTSPSTCNEQKGCANDSPPQISYHALDYTSDAHAHTRHNIPLPKQTEIPEKRILAIPIAVRGKRFENLSKGFGTMVPPMFCMQSQQSMNTQQFNHLVNQMNNYAIDQNDNKQQNKPETVEDRGHFSSADQSANSSYCNAMEEGFPNDGSSHRSTQREAALNKFRLKRKERCFEKKVRYESRRKLAEQRPRVKGQFVRQMHDEPPTGSS